MGMSQNYGPVDEIEAIATINRALDLGVNFLDTADLYGDGSNEELIGKTIAKRREEVTLATKFGRTRRPEGGLGPIIGTPEYVFKACDASLARLGVDYIDLYYQHRVDPSVPIEETWGALDQLVKVGKVRFLGLSEASVDSLERAAATHPISALQSEWSLWTRDIEDELLATARRLGIGLVPYSPLGRGFLTGKITTTDDFADDDFRRHNPRFEGENFERNVELVKLVRHLAADKGVSPAQLALAWLLAQGPDVVPIPGTKRRSNLEENAASVHVSLSPAERDQLSNMVPAGAWSGSRYADSAYTYGSSPTRSG